MTTLAVGAPTQPSSAPAPDLAAIKVRQQAAWASGDFAMIAARLVWPAEKLCEAADLQAGWRVLDVATGSGNAALAAARRGCTAVGVDYVPALLERGRKRAEAELLDVEFREGDAENLPFPDASFDAVTSIYGAMFAPNHVKTARELVRVCRPGGVIALASWTPEGFIGDTFRIVSKYVPMVAGVTPPIRWGDEAYLESIFGKSIRSITSSVQVNVFRYLSAEANVEFFRRYYGPTLKLFEAVGESGAVGLAKELADLARRYDRNGGKAGPIAIAAEYLETVIVTV
jgi:ubiquinone/menaquinone biosynthesis C-methylase UbiE